METKILGVLFLVVGFCSCGKKITIDNSDVTGADENLHWASIYEAHDGSLYAGGGQAWTEGVIAEYGKEGWKVVHQSSTAQVLTFAEADSILYAMSYSGHRFFKEGKKWHYSEPIHWERMHKIIPIGDEFLVIGGERRTTCTIYRVTGKHLDTWQLIVDSLDFYPLTASLTEDGDLYVGGYGHVYVSHDTARSWIDVTPAEGIFKQMQAIGNKIYVMNDKGALYVNDRGAHWEKIHSSRPDRRFNGMYFHNPEEGYLVGDSGIILFTTDGGKSWKTYRLIGKKTINAIHRKGDRLYICGNEGLLDDIPML